MIGLALRCAALLGLAFTGTQAQAQNTGGIFPPMVKAGHKSAQYRGTYDPDSEGYAQRLHYQQSVNTDFMWRGLVQARKTDESDVDFDFFQAELFWEISDDDDDWRTGFRFDGRIRDDGRPGQIGVNWMNQWPLAEDFSARFLVLTSADVGDDARDGVFFQTRGQIAYTGMEKGSLALELYNSYGALDDIRDFEEQRHQFGPTITWPIAKDVRLYVNTLFGLTDATPDNELRFWLTKNF